jgi:hypothetical protein
MPKPALYPARPAGAALKPAAPSHSDRAEFVAFEGGIVVAQILVGVAWHDDHGEHGY